MSGKGILFFSMSNWSVVGASQSVIRWCKISLDCLHNLQTGSILGFNFDWKYARLLWSIILLIHVLICACCYCCCYDIFLTFSFLEDFKCKKGPNTDLLRLVMSVFEPSFSVCSWVCSLSYSLAELFCVDILEPKAVLGQYLKPMTCQVKAEWDCYRPTIYRLTLQLTNICVIRLCKYNW